VFLAETPSEKKVIQEARLIVGRKVVNLAGMSHSTVQKGEGGVRPLATSDMIGWMKQVRECTLAVERHVCC
jgi:hypothetical protein